ncbi:hypothetical protein [Legionella pneumophila]|uniref:hypothetical protein n=1 Tax=Legionella pneumophila TaxID=446 RepID=UPI0007708A9C|nr:hypothetical protein [Legionella pneumophila]HAT9213634.1 hypothetical protein [Legionella pneumophila subsp. pneumophila]MCW8401138.1 hypothetical protein [Legionella pneumophila]MCZ4698202.1 hypothetical protein [Legionella pneumophila]MCZ4713607.1 hypothetical protein [Legionella pneumophila]MCZ4744100.1 hypothetical protein [Legionella pneumophila]
MNIFEVFSACYANGVTAVVAVIALLAACITLWFLKRDHALKYRPYLTPVVIVEPQCDKLGFIISINPCNVGLHPCKAKVYDIKLKIGDETYITPDVQELLLSHVRVGVSIPAGNINETGVTKIRQGQYKKNRIELNFIIESKSIENKYKSTQKYSFEINVLGERAQAFIRPEWIENV